MSAVPITWCRVQQVVLSVLQHGQPNLWAKLDVTSCGASFAFLASFLGMKVHELFLNQLSFEVDAGLDVFDENVLVPAGTIPQAARF